VVREHDAPVGGHDHRGIGSRVEEIVESLLGALALAHLAERARRRLLGALPRLTLPGVHLDERGMEPGVLQQQHAEHEAGCQRPVDAARVEPDVESAGVQHRGERDVNTHAIMTTITHRSSTECARRRPRAHSATSASTLNPHTPPTTDAIAAV
jgi:hypothetical protein